MRQQGTVESAEGEVAVVCIERESACSGDCHKCSGCGAVKQTLRIQAGNPIGAQRGDRVYVESSGATVLWGAVLVYLLPILGFLAGYCLGYAVGHPALWSVTAFLLSWIPALWYNRRVKKRPPVYTLTAFLERE